MSDAMVNPHPPFGLPPIEKKAAPRSGVTEIAVERDRMKEMVKTAKHPHVFASVRSHDLYEGAARLLALEILRYTFPAPVEPAAWIRERAETLYHKTLSDPEGRLAIVGALIAAEIDRLKAAGVKGGGSGAPAGEAKEREEKTEPGPSVNLDLLHRLLNQYEYPEARDGYARRLHDQAAIVRNLKVEISDLKNQLAAAKAEALRYLEAYHGAKAAAENMEKEWAEALAENAKHRKDIEDAAGELPIGAVIPGSMAAKLLQANRLLRHANQDLLSRATKAEAQVAEQDTVTEGGCDCGPQGLMISLAPDPRVDQLAKDVEQLRRMVVGV